MAHARKFLSLLLSLLLSLQSQRDCISQPRVARNELPWVSKQNLSNPNGVASNLRNLRKPFYPFSKNLITVSPCFSIFLSRQKSGTLNVSRFVCPNTNEPPAASTLGKFPSSKSCCANEVERRPTFFSP